MNNLCIPASLWWRLLSELRRRGCNCRESGAFLLAKKGSNKVSKFVCYDDLDPTALNSGIVIFHGVGFARLWDVCLSCRMQVVGDAHTHPSSWTEQSESDRTNPMIGNPGHIALIFPCFASRRLQTLSGVGIYEYLGDHQWEKWSATSNKVRITIV
jgi:hypothetical protein